MKTVRYDGSQERHGVAAMIGDKRVLSEVAAVWEAPGSFPSRWANLVAGWCVDYYRAHEAAPGRLVEVMFARWADGREAKGDGDTVNLVEKFLAGLPEPAEVPNHRFTVDSTLAVLEKGRLEAHLAKVKQHIDLGDMVAAEKERAAYRRIESGPSSYVNFFTDPARIQAALEIVERNDPLISYPGALGDFFGTELDRDQLIAFTAPPKRTKSFWLQDIAFRAVMKRRKVLYISAGDMTRDQVLRRFAARAARRPTMSQTGWPLTYQYPESMRWVQREGGRRTVEVTHSAVTVDRPPTWQEVAESAREFHDFFVGDGADDHLRIVCEPAGSLAVGTIRALAERWAREDWVADVIVIDYADLLRGRPGLKEERERIDSVWRDLRALSQVLYCLVVTATQSNADGYTSRNLTERNFAGSRTINDHLTGKIAINYTREDEQSGYQRLDWIFRRDAAKSQTCYVAPCLPICHPAVLSL